MRKRYRDMSVCKRAGLPLICLSRRRRSVSRSLNRPWEPVAARTKKGAAVNVRMFGTPACARVTYHSTEYQDGCG